MAHFAPRLDARGFASERRLGPESVRHLVESQDARAASGVLPAVRDVQAEGDRGESSDLARGGALRRYEDVDCACEYIKGIQTRAQAYSWRLLASFAVSVSGRCCRPETRRTNRNKPLLSISAAAAVVCLDLFQRASSTETLAQERSEVQTALTTLKQMSTFSAIARRGASLIENLLEEESKLPPCADSDAEAGRPAKRRRRTGGEGPTLAAAPVLSGPSPMASRSPGFLPTVLVSPPSNHSSGQDLPAAASLPSLSDSSLMTSPPHRPSKGSTSTLTDPLPAEFVNVFLENGFDPLDGAITSAQQQDASWLPMLFPSPSPS